MLRPAIATLLSLGLAMAAAAHNHHDSGENAATGFYRPGASVPAGADLSRGDVPRDDYGRPYTYEGLGKPLPAFTGETVSQTTFASSQLADQWTVIEVWGIWCHDSRRDAKYAAALATALAQDPDVSFMSIHTPQNAKNAERALRGPGSMKRAGGFQLSSMQTRRSVTPCTSDGRPLICSSRRI